MKNKDNIPPPEASNPIVTGSKEAIQLNEAQDKDAEIGIMNMFKGLKETIDEHLRENHENTNSCTKNQNNSRH